MMNMQFVMTALAPSWGEHFWNAVAAHLIGLLPWTILTLVAAAAFTIGLYLPRVRNSRRRGTSASSPAGPNRECSQTRDS